ncbi:MAG: nucleotidyltransferase domain-containing protein [Nanoarchaeota archaeon]|nr:nucleotidyltransferase domain-containing protein [Nanoarchaeota archaeon]MBU1270248.1 nucleotidyltransferase domain-containing protein [Nanoarchaeota archaeon]MBU1603681.1 nucleotidyltransferase domain-containing protein [Nanoarchaeota archaeon]MBU2443738.1 nucleotidyltransferase domain-containing protein [Nanoarchaeota archaeon]
MTQIKINYEFEVLLLLLKKEMHGRELAKELKTSLTRVQSTLNQLRNINVLDFKVEGKNHIYFIKRNLVSRSFILNAENYKLVKLLDKHPELEPIFEDIIKKSNYNLILLFGSYAKGNQKKESDIDIYIETTDPKIKDEVQKIYDLISVKIGKFNPEDLLIKEIIKNHIIIKGGEEYYETLKFFN